MRKTRRKRNRASGRKFPLVLIILMAACVIYNGWNCVDGCVTMARASIPASSSEPVESSASSEASTEDESPGNSSGARHVSRRHVTSYIVRSTLKYSLMSGFEIIAIYFGYRLITQSNLFGDCDGLISPGNTTVSFDDIAGLEEIKEELLFLVSLLKKDESAGSYRIPRGILLEGPPGNGKTMLAKALAHDAGVNFIALRGSDVKNPYVGVASMRIKSVFEKAQKNAPCIIFLDEIDAIGCKRDANPAGAVDKEENSTLTTLLNYLDGFTELDGVMVIAATNMASSLDPALTRPGRFDKHFTINNPDFQTRQKLFSLFTKDCKQTTFLDLRHLAQKTYGFNSAQIQNIVNEAHLLAIKDKRDLPEAKDFDNAIVHVQLKGFERKDVQRSAKDIETAAYHEAGHAIVAYHMDHQSVGTISIRPTTAGAGGYTMIESSDENNFKPLQSVKNRIAILYGGRASEAKLYGSIDNARMGASQDIRTATEIASGYVSAEKGIDFTLFGQAGTEKVMNYSQELLSEMWEVSRTIVSDHWNEIVMIAEELMQNETITAERFGELMECGSQNMQGK